MFGSCSFNRFIAAAVALLNVPLLFHVKSCPLRSLEALGGGNLREAGKLGEIVDQFSITWDFAPCWFLSA